MSAKGNRCSTIHKRKLVLRLKKKLCLKYPKKYKIWMCLARIKHTEESEYKRCRKRCINGKLRCKLHGGKSPGAPIKTGKYSIQTDGDFIELYEQFLTDPHAIDLVDELAMLRALVRDLVTARANSTSKQDSIELAEKISSVIDTVGRMAERLRKIHVSYFSMESVRLVVQQLINIIEDGIRVCPHCKKEINSVREEIAQSIFQLNMPGTRTDPKVLHGEAKLLEGSDSNE